MPNSQNFAANLLEWFDNHGRHDLPWANPRTPYRVWISEVMLQQTQVATVIPYFERFVARFPDVRTLADANVDDVLQHWAGLGYYARGRNLHRAAGIICAEHGGEMPQDFAQVAALPGIGRSTAGAILALGSNQHFAILDGNVKRVLTRFHAIEGWPGEKVIENALWAHAERHTPMQRVTDYTQAIMDLGATLCTRSKPKCGECPLRMQCQALAFGRTRDFPQSRPKKIIPTRTTRMLILRNTQGEVLLAKRPPVGIWGGLWSLPECPIDVDTPSWARDVLRLNTSIVATLPSVRHTFSHFHLDITPVVCSVENPTLGVMEANDLVWYKSHSPNDYGLPAPVKRILNDIEPLKEYDTDGSHG